MSDIIETITDIPIQEYSCNHVGTFNLLGKKSTFTPGCIVAMKYIEQKEQNGFDFFPRLREIKFDGVEDEQRTETA